MVILRTVAALVLVLAVVSPAGAQNLVTNPTFDSNVEGWAASDAGTSLSHSNLDGFVDPGAAVVFGQSVDASSGISQCVTVSDPGPLLVVAAGKADNYAPATLIVNLASFSDATCFPLAFLEIANETAPVTESDHWQVVEMTTEPPPGTMSVQVLVTIKTEEPVPFTESWFDDIWVGPEPPLFADGFETGDLTVWSASLP